MTINKEFKNEFKQAMASHAYWLRGGKWYGERAVFNNADFSNVSFDGYALNYATFNSCNAGSIYGIEKISFATFEKCMINIMFEGTCSRATFYGCKINTILHTTFCDCNFRHCNVRNCHISYVTFCNCDFYAADFTGCTFEGVRFVGCKNVPKNALT